MNGLRDVWHNMSWRSGFRQGQDGVPFKAPWWSNPLVCGIAYMQGKAASAGVKTTTGAGARARKPKQVPANQP